MPDARPKLRAQLLYLAFEFLDPAANRWTRPYHPGVDLRTDLYHLADVVGNRTERVRRRLKRILKPVQNSRLSDSPLAPKV
jgi:hypothetical protein